ncbi:hypothetical protein GCM10009764_14570 [Nocardia ninae]
MPDPLVAAAPTKVPARPRATIAPAAASARHAWFTVAGDTFNSRATSRTVGSRAPGVNVPERISLLTAAAIPAGVRSARSAMNRPDPFVEAITSPIRSLTPSFCVGGVAGTTTRLEIYGYETVSAIL